jgi:cytochrome c oxidase subunit 5a
MLTTTLRAAARPSLALAARTTTIPTLTHIRLSSSAHSQETFESFSARYTAFFSAAEDIFEVQRGLNNCFAHDLVPSPGVIEAAVRAARRVDDYATAVRIFEGIKEKVENEEQYKAYLEELKDVREELGGCLSFSFFETVAALATGDARTLISLLVSGIETKEEMYPPP